VRVGILCEHSDPARGGAESYLAALTERLRLHGHDVIVAARTGPHARPMSNDPGHPDRVLVYRDEFLPWLRDEGADVVLTTAPVEGCEFFQPHNGALAVSVPSHYSSLPWGARHFRGWNPARRAHFVRLEAHEAAAARAPTTVLAVSPRVERDFLEHYPGSRVLVLRPGVDLDMFQPPPNPNGPLLFVSGNFRLKGLGPLLRTVRRNPPLRLTIAGGKWRRPAPRAEFLGRVEDMPAFYRSGSLLVHPTFYDSAAGVVLEALASGLPVVSSVHDGNSDLAVEAGGAAIQDPRDTEALAHAIEQALSAADPERSRAVAERYPAAAMLDRVVETLTG